ncbi:tetratricopeptide repeat protein [Calothrix sp. FACHB-156]|nr:tetratricopeptide repeat protein [Nostoc linckia FACHB-104]MBD2341206.1 tetratricopeptide repeat protein [Calothrix sp. FACHB-156]
MLGEDEQHLTHLLRKRLAYYLERLSISRRSHALQEELTCLSQLAAIYEKLFNFAQALEYHKLLLALSQRMGAKDWQEIALYNIGNCYFQLRQNYDAVKYFTKLVKITCETGNRVLHIAGISALGTSYQNLGQFQIAIEHFKNQLAISCEINQRTCQKSALASLAKVYQCLGNYQESLRYEQKALLIAQEMEDIKAIGDALGNIASIYLQLQQWQQAINYCNKSLLLAKAIDNQSLVMISFNILGQAYKGLHDYHQAIDCLTTSLNISDELGESRVRSVILHGLSDLCIQMNLSEQAREYKLESLSINRQPVEAIGVTHHNLVKQDCVLAPYQQSVNLLQDIGNQQNQQQLLFNLGYIYYSSARFSQAMGFLQSALIIAQAQKNNREAAKISLTLGNTLQRLHHSEEAIYYYRYAYKIYQMLGDKHQIQKMLKFMDKLGLKL